jgi:hypothetical protein
VDWVMMVRFPVVTQDTVFTTVSEATLSHVRLLSQQVSGTAKIMTLAGLLLKAPVLSPYHHCPTYLVLGFAVPSIFDLSTK